MAISLCRFSDVAIERRSVTLITHRMENFDMSSQLSQQPSVVSSQATTKKWLIPAFLMAAMILSFVYYSGLACKMGLPQEASPCPIVCPPGTTCINIGSYWACI